MPNLKPFRDINEHDVLNLFKHISGTVPKGTFVKIVSGFNNEDSNLNMGTDALAATYGNTLSPRWSVKSYVETCTSGDVAIGFTLYDVKESDENGERTYYNPRKAAEMQCVISGQAVPIATKGYILYSGVSGAGQGGLSAVSAGVSVYTNHNGELTTSGAAASKVGYTLGPKDSKGWTLIKVDL